MFLLRDGRGPPLSISAVVFTSWYRTHVGQTCALDIFYCVKQLIDSRSAQQDDVCMWSFSATLEITIAQ